MPVHLDRPWIRSTALLLTPVLAGCGWWTVEQRPDPVADGPPGVALDHLPLVELDLPPDNRGGAPPTERLPLVGWKPLGGHGGSYIAPNPARPRALFYFRPPPGVRLEGRSGTTIPFDRAADPAGPTWMLDQQSLVVSGISDPSRLEGWTLVDPLASVRERRLNRAFSDTADLDAFVRSTLQVGDETLTGLFVPAPGVVAVDVDVPPAAELHLVPGIVPPEARDLGHGDGATLVIEVDDRGSTREVWRGHLTEGRFDPVRVDLHAFSGRTVRLRMRTEPGATAVYDYVLVGDPRLVPRRTDARRVVVLFIDTLRKDHLGTYGYGRPTSPWLDRVARRGTRFEEARSVAPWTLPSYRSTLTGRMPWAWDQGETLPGQLRERGWSTAMFAGNMYLSTRFGGSRGWGRHHLVNWPSADEQVDRAIAWLDAQEGQDALMLLHFMDPHLPYQEPASHRRVFAGDAPGGWPETFHRGTVLQRRVDDDARAWIVARYDNNIRYVDDALSRLGQHLTDEDLIVVFSDHGEEFWDHGSFEHGHTLHEELLHVPLIVAGPQIPPGASTEPVSLLDLTPTILDWAGLPVPEGDGRSLLRPVDPGRLRGVGHLLYGNERWGVYADDHKYLSVAGKESLLDLREEPPRDAWSHRLDDQVGSWREKLSSAFHSPVVPSFRVAVDTLKARPPRGLEVRLGATGGVAHAWLGEDAIGAAHVEVEQLEERVTARWPADWRGLRELYVTPARPGEARPVVEVRQPGTAWVRLVVPEADRTAPDGTDTPLARYTLSDGTRVTLTFGVAPRPGSDTTPPTGYDPELRGMLESAGYVRDAEALP